MSRTSLIARSCWGQTPNFPPIFPFPSPGAELLLSVVGATIMTSGETVSLVIDVSQFLGPAQGISNAWVTLIEAAGVDPTPGRKVFGNAQIIAAGGRQRQAIRQVFYALYNGGQYVALATVRTADGTTYRFAAPFLTEGPNPAITDENPFVLDDSDLGGPDVLI